ncbi:SulP family inorganic anion transporter [Ornithinimicrobium humiphilum]|uniref:SulP family sulfate permease n=1 Tax=Ornithinimicrobium humiphilum TaxID=125288 RepID=A0A543KP16_9MICO|nr:SulP family inorganic anion transporter [Ornithinimicrobium humiphilum]TQM96804.1 SulP family sulfate permease [Ornithinimicrobium humiphilum]
MPEAASPAPEAPRPSVVPEAGERDTSTLAALRDPRRLRTEALAGLVVALALIPEAISFAIIAGVDPRMGLFSSFIMAVTISVVGGRPAMISAATGAVALVIAPVARQHGLDYFLATVLLAGVLQIVLALLGVARLMRFIPRMVMVGFVNSLAMLVLIAQVPHVVGVPWLVYPLVALGIAVIVAFPRLTTAIPAPLVAIVVVTALVVATGWRVPDVADQGALPTSLPWLVVPDVPLTLDTLRIIGPYALAMALVGLLESLLTAKLVDGITDTHSDKTREAWGQGVANLTSGLFGGMGGCAVIGQTMMNVKVAGARTRISTFLAGVFLLALVLGAGPLVGMIPMAALVAVMIMVSVATIDWHSLHPATLRRMPHSENLVMLLTMGVTVATGNLAYGVLVGVNAAIILFARRVARFASVVAVGDRDVDGDGAPDVRTYKVSGELFFATSNDLVYQFDYAGDPTRVVVDLSDSHIWDASTVAALDAVRTKYERVGKTVEIVGLNEASAARHARLSGRLGEEL